MSWVSKKQQSFRPLKVWGGNPHREELKRHRMETLHLGDFRQAVKLPEGEDLNEWFAVNLADFFNQISILYFTVAEYCTEQSCPVMSAGPAYKYLWRSGNKKHSKPQELSAPAYINALMDWVEGQLSDDAVFPSQIDVPFPKNFQSICKEIMKRLFRVYAHCYYHHLETFKEADMGAHLDTSFKHFVFFAMEFKMIPHEQMEPMKDLIESMMQA